jgi:hypothetical protein
LPEEWLIERIQQVGATSRKLLSASFIGICFTFAVVFRALGYIFVTSRHRTIDSVKQTALWTKWKSTETKRGMTGRFGMASPGATRRL